MIGKFLGPLGYRIHFKVRPNSKSILKSLCGLLLGAWCFVVFIPAVSVEAATGSCQREAHLSIGVAPPVASLAIRSDFEAAARPLGETREPSRDTIADNGLAASIAVNRYRQAVEAVGLTPQNPSLITQRVRLQI